MTNVTLIYSPPREVIVIDSTSEVEVKSNQPQIFFNRLNQQMPSLAGQVLLRPTKPPTTPTVPTLALRDRAGDPILDRNGDYILTREE